MDALLDNVSVRTYLESQSFTSLSISYVDGRWHADIERGIGERECLRSFEAEDTRVLVKEIVYFCAMKLRQTITAEALARALYKDDCSRAAEVPVIQDGHAAYDGWVRASSDAGDRDTLDALKSVDRDAFAAEWERLVSC